ncbi:hypothetical protein [Halorubrum laminariae]|uniref:Uncharacterized protein n=1 Tax=Halorubrum laminariae TaxID=1433523 RepID=A0ABD6C0G7_9EURY|nr:hypothetical protein [Halorubrum laminariae]
MTDESSRFTSDRRPREGASWETGEDWLNGTTENVVVVGGELVAQTPLDDGVPTSEKWQKPVVANSEGIARTSGDGSIDGDVSTYSVLDSSESGYIEYSVDQEYKQIRFDFDGTKGSIDISLQPSGTVIKEDWDVSGNPWYVVSLDDELDNGWKSSENFRVQVDDSTNKRIAEVEVDVDT